ncbi:MAG: methylenetetrahydrofolate reductase [NAD(P)H] [Lachnospiraceae bacterium]|nr:methylenetetrahydrofolate reductase [NAD(P)H] [Lachnospiraceae bacterium]
MRISDLLKGDSVTISFEVFPPKKADGLEAVREATEKIAALSPSYMSVTYGAGGSSSKLTLEIAKNIQERFDVPVIPHFTCVSSTKERAEEEIRLVQEAGIENLMALRGDIPLDGATEHDFPHAVDLIRFIRERSDICIGAACYPEGHVESAHKADDIRYLKEKVDAGADFLVTQMFFDNNIFYNFLYRARDIGITCPIVPGIMPITRAKQLGRSVALSGTNVPERFRAIVDHFGENPDAMKKVGIIYATDQIIDLLANGIRHIHVYSMNKPDVAAAIMENLTDIIK